MRIVIALAACALAGCATPPVNRASTEPLTVVPSVDVNRYLGRWYEIARLENGFEKGCEGVTADYSRRDDGLIRVLNTCREGSTSGKARVAVINYRQRQTGEYFYKFDGLKGYCPGKTKQDFLKENQAGPGPANPQKIPYYLLLVGSPEQIPYSFQVQMDVQYSVGRIYFETPEEYANYARSVVAAEAGKVRLPRRAAFFGTANEDDFATELSASSLIQPVLDKLGNEHNDWTLTPYLGEQATKAQLSGLLGGSVTFCHPHEVAGSIRPDTGIVLLETPANPTLDSGAG